MAALTGGNLTVGWPLTNRWLLSLALTFAEGVVMAHQRSAVTADIPPSCALKASRNHRSRDPDVVLAGREQCHSGLTPPL